jgi:hypothetical protein
VHEAIQWVLDSLTLHAHEFFIFTDKSPESLWVLGCGCRRLSKIKIGVKDFQIVWNPGAREINQSWPMAIRI